MDNLFDRSSTTSIFVLTVPAFCHNFEKAELCRNVGRKWKEGDPKETGQLTDCAWGAMTKYGMRVDRR
jgi:hypothetical protein